MLLQAPDGYCEADGIDFRAMPAGGTKPWGQSQAWKSGSVNVAMIWVPLSW